MLVTDSRSNVLLFVQNISKLSTTLPPRVLSLSICMYLGTVSGYKGLPLFMARDIMEVKKCDIFK